MKFRLVYSVPAAVMALAAHAAAQPAPTTDPAPAAEPAPATPSTEPTVPPEPAETT